MKNIILQHWSGPMIELTQLSSDNMSKYAEQLGADYKMLLGDVFRSHLAPPCQKMYMLDEIFDEYDMVVMVDADMFTCKDIKQNVFTDVKGIGRSDHQHAARFINLHRRFPKLTHPDYPYWGGSIWRLTREERQRLRVHINEKEMIPFSGNFSDEGIMHRLAMLAKIEKSNVIPNSYWNHGSFEPGVEQAQMIHIRTKIAPAGPKRDKIVNYRGLIEDGLIAAP